MRSNHIKIISFKKPIILTVTMDFFNYFQYLLLLLYQKVMFSLINDLSRYILSRLARIKKTCSRLSDQKLMLVVYCANSHVFKRAFAARQSSPLFICVLSLTGDADSSGVWNDNMESFQWNLPKSHLIAFLWPLKGCERNFESIIWQVVITLGFFWSSQQ